VCAGILPPRFTCATPRQSGCDAGFSLNQHFRPLFWTVNRQQQIGGQWLTAESVALVARHTACAARFDAKQIAAIRSAPSWPPPPPDLGNPPS
jgi:hypothetical protein